MSTMIERPTALQGSTPAVRIQDLVVSYRRRGRSLQVIRGVSIDVAPGEAYGLVGESGCGKTTVAMTLMRYLPRNAVVESGTIELDGEDLLGMREERLRELRGNRMSMVYQESGSSLNPTLRVGEQIAEVYRFHGGMSRADASAAAHDMLGRVRIADVERFARRYPHEISGGQKQRVGIAMALAADPTLLVLDEPTTGLDATVEAEILDLVGQLRLELGTSILFISHNLGIVSKMCDRVGVLYAGKLVEEGPAADVLEAPRHPYTLALLRCVPRLGMRKDVMRLDPIPGSLPPLGADVPACVFADRCVLARDRCRVEAPPPVAAGDGHVSYCHYVDEVASIPQIDRPAAPQGERDPDATPLLSVRRVQKNYQDVQAVADVSFEIRPGEILGLVGESGSGKSSLARCIVGLTDATGGEITLGETGVSQSQRRRNRTLRRALQMVFQDPDTSLNPRRSGRSLLRRAVAQLAGARGEARERRIDELLVGVRLEQRHLQLKPVSLSGGLKQRLAIASAFAGDPELVVCDEPVSALDVSVQAAILNLLSDLQATQGVSYLLISHDLGVVRYLADRIVVMYLGESVEIGPAEAVFASVHHPYTEALLSAIPTIGKATPRRERIRLVGSMPSASEPPSGCRFHTRCPRFLGEQCRTQAPPWQQAEDGHAYRCHIEPDRLRKLQTSSVAPVRSE